MLATKPDTWVDENHNLFQYLFQYDITKFFSMNVLYIVNFIMMIILCNKNFFFSIVTTCCTFFSGEDMRNIYEIYLYTKYIFLMLLLAREGATSCNSHRKIDTLMYLFVRRRNVTIFKHEEWRRISRVQIVHGTDISLCLWSSQQQHLFKKWRPCLAESTHF